MRIIVIVGFLIGFALVLNEYIPPLVYLQIGENKMSETKVYSRSLPNPSARILIVGDGTGYGVGASSPDKSFAGLLGNQHKEISITNSSKAGANLEDVFEQITKHNGEEFDVIIILAGGNDIFHVRDVEKVRTSIQKVFIEAQKIASNTIFVPEGNIGLMPIVPFGLAQYYSAKSEDHLEAYRDESYKYDVIFVNTFVSKSNSKHKQLFSTDQYHLNDEGYRYLFGIFTSVLEKSVVNLQ